MKRKKYIYTMTALASLMMSGGASAQISPLAFKGVTQYFKKDQEFYSPVLGAAALEAGVIYNLRFYGNVKRAQGENGQPLPMKDSGMDSLAMLVKLFFPSPAGQLAVETTAANSFGKFVDHPESVAHLLNFAKLCREHLFEEESLKQEKDQQAQSIKNIDEEIKGLRKAKANNGNVLKTPSTSGENIASLKQQNFDLDRRVKVLLEEKNKHIQSKTIKVNELKDKEDSLKTQFKKQKDEILSHLEKSLIFKGTESKIEKLRNNFDEHRVIVNTIEQAIREESTSPYPTHMTEQVINSFFCEKFNTQQDIWTLLKSLDGDIVDKTQSLPAQENYLEEKDLPEIASKPLYDRDDIFDLSHARNFSQLIPYNNSHMLISNGNTYPYDRKTDKILESAETFADCVEVAGRHVMNLLLFNSEKECFDLSSLEQRVRDRGANPYFENFVKFYKTQPPHLSNDGNINTRSLWNKVVGDLNDDPSSLFPVTYKHNNKYEMQAGFINLIRAFQKIFNLSLTDLPPESNKEDRKTWVEKSLVTLFKEVNADREYDVDVSQLNNPGDPHELSGTIPVTVQDLKTKEEIFSFNFYSRFNIHSQINDLTLLKQPKVSYAEEIQSHKNTLQEQSTDETLWLLDAALKDKVHHPLYRLLATHIMDNDSRIEVLKTLEELYPSWKISSHFQKDLPWIQSMVTNILDDISWDDRHVVQDISPVIFNLYKQAGEHIKFIKFNQLKMLDLSESMKINDISLKDMPQLTTLDLRNSSVESMTAENLPSLESINLEVTSSLKKLTLKDIPQIERVDLTDSTVVKMTAENLPILEKVKFKYNQRSNNKRLTELTLKDMSQLKKLKLEETHIKKLVAENLPVLKKIDLMLVKNFEELTLKDMSQLKKLFFVSFNSNIKKIDLENLSALEGLYLTHKKNLEELNLRNMPALTKILLERSIIKTSVVLENLDSLEKLVLPVSNISGEITFKGSFKSLKKINFEGLQDRNKVKIGEDVEDRIREMIHTALPQSILKTENE